MPGAPTLALALLVGAPAPRNPVISDQNISIRVATVAAMFAGALSCRPTAPSRNDPDAQAAAALPRAQVLGTPATYWGSVAGILRDNCVACHAPGGVGPMPLTTYAAAKENVTGIVATTQSRKMPPWLPDTTQCSPLQHARSLSPSHTETLAEWLRAGTPEGDRAQYEVPAPKARPSALGETPSFVAKPQAEYLPKAGEADDYRCFVLDPTLPEDARIVAVRVTPSAPAIVHHALLFEVRKSAVALVLEADGKDPGPGYACFGGIGVNPSLKIARPESGRLVDFDVQMVTAWAPGGGATEVAGAPNRFPAGTGLEVAKDSKLVLQVHYATENSRPGMRDGTKVELWYAARAAPLRMALWIPVSKYDFRIPVGVGPDDPRAEARTELALPFGVEVLGVIGHMHLRGKRLRMEAAPRITLTPTTASGDPTCLLDIPQWDFHHQEAYWLTKGTWTERVSLSCRYDNRVGSQPKSQGRTQPPRELRWGEKTTDEMCLGFLFAAL